MEKIIIHPRAVFPELGCRCVYCFLLCEWLCGPVPAPLQVSDGAGWPSGLWLAVGAGAPPRPPAVGLGFPFSGGVSGVRPRACLCAVARLAGACFGWW